MDGRRTSSLLSAVAERRRTSNWLGTTAEQWQVTVLPYPLLAFCALLTVIIEGPTGRTTLINLGLSALAAAWMLWMFTLHAAWRERPRVMAVFFAGLVLILAVLVFRAPWYGFFSPAGYFFAFRLLPWPWRLPGVAAVAVLAGTAQSYGVNKDTLFGVVLYLAIVATNVILICVTAWLDWDSDRRNEERAQALAEVSEANRRLEATLAENAGLHEQLLTQAREAGVLDERQRMAGEIHDTLAQGLAGIITQLQAAEQASEDRAGWRRHVQAATRLARESLSEARRSVDALRPEPLEAARLSDALTGVGARWSALNGVAVQVTTTGTVRPMRPEAELALLRTAQEALANVAKHAHATRVVLTLSFMDDEVALDVRDDGAGFDPARLADGAPERSQPALAGPYATATAGDRPRLQPAGGGGFGLVAMRQRIEGLSGTLQVESEPGAGTAISACVPAALADVSG
jgi:signal transduction histidine kinase